METTRTSNNSLMTAPLAPITAPVPLPLPPHSRSQMEVNTAITPEASKPLPLNFSPSFDCLSMAPPPIVRGEKRVMTSKGRWEVDKQDYLIYTDYEEVDAPVRPVVAEKTKLVSPGDVQIQPNAKIIFNAPFDVKHIYFVKIINASERRIGWAVKKTSMKHVNVTPACGVLDARENVRLSVSCDVFDGQRVPNKDRLTVVWTITPIGVDKKFRREWLQKDGIIRRKNLPIEYNP